MKKIYVSIVFALITVISIPSVTLASKPLDAVNKAKILNKTYRMQVPFIENKGQVDDDSIGFYARTFGGTVFVGKDGTITYSLPIDDKGGVVIKEVFTENTVEVKGLEPSPTRINYFKGNDRTKWKANIPSYNSVSLGEVYKGVELTLQAYGKNVEKLFKVLPGKDPRAIKVRLQGAKDLRTNERGELEVVTEMGFIMFTKPIAYQEIDGKRVEVEVAYQVQETEVRRQKSEDKDDSHFIPQSEVRNSQWEDSQLNALPGPGTSFVQCQGLTPSTYGFKVADFDKAFPLIIDPLLASTFLGGGSNESGGILIIDGTGNLYVTGFAESGYPTIAGAYDISHNGAQDVFVSKLDSTLSNLLVSTFIGGSGNDYGHSLAIDIEGNVYVAGRADSDYPTTAGAYDESHNGGDDVFVSKLDNNLSSLIASTFLGGGGGDSAQYLILDTSNNLYIAGIANDGYPTTPGAYDESNNGGPDVFISKLNSDLSTLLASTFIGGSNGEVGECLALNNRGNVYVTGKAQLGFPTTLGTYDSSYNGGDDDVFISKLNSDLSTLLASTFIGGPGEDRSYSLSIDNEESVYVTGDAEGGYPITPGAYDESHNNNKDIFVSKLDSDLSSLLASTFLGGTGNDTGYFLALDENDNVYVTGRADSFSNPTTPGAYDETFNGDEDAFISKLDANLGSLLASTFLGGTTIDYAHALTLDNSGNVYVSGITFSTDFPTTPEAYDASYNGGAYDVFISNLDKNLLAGVSLRSAVDTGGEFAGSSQFLEELSYLDDPFAIVQCQHYTITIDFWLTDWQEQYNVKSINYHLTLDTGLLSVLSVTSENPQWNIHSEPDPDEDGIYHLYLESTDGNGIPGPNIKLHTVELSFIAVPSTGWVKAELLPDGFITDVNDDTHQSIGKTELTLKTICDVNATTTCDEANPCDVLDSNDICPVDAVIIQNNYSWEPVDPENPLCEGDLITIYHTKTGTYLVEKSCTEDICPSECFNSCLTACREIETNECTVRGIGHCINGIVFPWDETTCFNYSRIVDCNGECLEDCTDDCEDGNAFYNHSCGFHMDGEEITMRVPDGTGDCTGEVKRQRTLTGDGTAWMPMTLPMEDGSYDICGGSTFIGTVVVEACGEPTCSLSLPGGFAVNHGATDTIEVTLENLNAGDTYALSLGWWQDDDHTIPLIGFPDSLEIDLETDEVLPEANETVTFNIKATNAEPGSNGQTHWANIMVKADPASVSYDWVCECSFDFDVISDEDGDGIPLEEDNCPDTANPDQYDTYPPGGNNIGDACDCEADFTCDGDVDADDVTTFLEHFGREEYYLPCTSVDPCIGDFICDADVDADDVTLFLEDFGREEYYNPCPACDAGAWCVYE